MWFDKVKTDNISKDDILKYLIKEMNFQKDVYTKNIRKGTLSENEAIKRASCCKKAFLIIKELNEKENGVQKTLFD